MITMYTHAGTFPVFGVPEKGALDQMETCMKGVTLRGGDLDEAPQAYGLTK